MVKLTPSIATMAAMIVSVANAAPFDGRVQRATLHVDRSPMSVACRLFFNTMPLPLFFIHLMSLKCFQKPQWDKSVQFWCNYQAADSKLIVRGINGNSWSSVLIMD